MTDDLPFHLARTALTFRRFNDRTLRAAGLGSQAPGLATVLHVLKEVEDCTVATLVSQTHLPNGTLTGLLDTLERDGCIERVKSPTDGRSRRVHLTKKGTTLCARLQKRHALVMAMFRDVLSKAETVELKRLLARINTRMRAYRGGDDDGGSG